MNRTLLANNSTSYRSFSWHHMLYAPHAVLPCAADRLAQLCLGAHSCCCFAVGPDSSVDAGGAGAVVFIDVKELQEVRRVGMPKHAAAVKWHSRLNQIFVGVGEQLGLLALGLKPQRVQASMGLQLSLRIQLPVSDPWCR